MEKHVDRVIRGEVPTESWVHMIDPRICESEVWQAMDMITDFFEFLQNSPTNIKDA